MLDQKQSLKNEIVYDLINNILLCTTRSVLKPSPNYRKEKIISREYEDDEETLTLFNCIGKRVNKSIRKHNILLW